MSPLIFALSIFSIFAVKTTETSSLTAGDANIATATTTTKTPDWNVPDECKVLWSSLEEEYERCKKDLEKNPTMQKINTWILAKGITFLLLCAVAVAVYFVAVPRWLRISIFYAASVVGVSFLVISTTWSRGILLSHLKALDTKKSS
jgi:hypothetical protein